MIGVAVTLNECDDGAQIGKHLVGEAELKIYEVLLSVARYRILLPYMDCGRDTPAQSQRNKSQVKFLFKGRCPASDFFYDRFDGNAITE
jgi:hypothetical protein